MKEYTYSADGNLRLWIDNDQKEENPRLDKDNLCGFETWDVVSPSPDFGAIHDLKRRLIHTLGKDENDTWRAYWIDKKGRNHARNDEYTMTLMVRILRAFGSSPLVRLLKKGEKGEILIADEWEKGIIVGIGYVYPLNNVQTEEQLLAFMQEELDKYNQWARGDVWQYTIESTVDCPCGGTHPGCTGSSWQQEISGDGIYGKNEALEDAALEWFGMEENNAGQ